MAPSRNLMEIPMHKNSPFSKNRKDQEGFFEPPNSFSDQVYERLKEKILLGEIEPGERLMQNQVAESLNASRTPVREAFRRLEQDGLVERVPQGGVRITRLDLETIQNVFGIRKVLEAYAVELACDRITGEEISALKRLMSQARETLKSSDLDLETKMKKLFDLNSEFHDTIYRAAGNSFLLGIISNLRNIVRRMRYLGLRVDSTWAQVWDEHSKLIECLEQKEKESATRLIQDHLVNAASYVLMELKSRG
jgi:GntR family transcriptional regulator, rspAB operon transcriptional repressor